MSEGFALTMVLARFISDAFAVVAAFRDREERLRLKLSPRFNWSIALNAWMDAASLKIDATIYGSLTLLVAFLRS